MTRTFERNMPDGSLVVAKAELDDGSGTCSAAFSLTGDVYERHGTWSGAAQRRNGREPDVWGMAHEEILRAFPSLATFAAMHLSNPDTGAPMHAEANGWYWYSSYDGMGTHLNDGRTDREVCAKYLRVPLSLLPDGLDRDQFGRFVDTLRVRWQWDARRARDLFA